MPIVADVPASSSSASRGTLKLTVVLNPASGRGTGARRRPELESLLEKAEANARECGREINWRIVQTERPGHGADLARKAVEEGAEIVAAAGGDGTYGEVVNGIAGTDAILGILPFGTGNDFSRHLGLGTDLAKAVETLFNGVAKPIDIGRVNDRYFINVAGCGFDAVVAARVNHGFRLLHGTAAYVAAVITSLIKFKPAPFKICVDGEAWETKAYLCSIANSQSFGGGMKIAPGARIDDGLLDICILGDAGKLEFLTAFPRVFKGTHVTHPKVTMLKASHITVESEPAMPILVDGEVMGRTPVEFTVQPGAIRVMQPVQMEGSA